MILLHPVFIFDVGLPPPQKIEAVPHPFIK
jgi:hypothetical protein